jgi:hypothetical protein
MKITLRATLGGFARVVGIVAIFSIVGPFAFAALILFLVVGVGAPFLELLCDFASLGSISTLVSVAAWVLTIGAMLAAFPPSVMTGVIFGLAAVCAGFNAVWMSWSAAAVAIAAIILIGAFYVPDESSAVLLPNIRGLEPVARAFVGLNLFALLPTTFCWWLAKPLHRARMVA